MQRRGATERSVAARSRARAEAQAPGAMYSRLNVNGPTLHVNRTPKRVSVGACGSRFHENLWTRSVTDASGFTACNCCISSHCARLAFTAWLLVKIGRAHV